MIDRKAIYYRKWKNGELGNRIKMWRDVFELTNDIFSGKVNIRHAVPASPYSLYNINKEDAFFVLNEHCYKYNLNITDFQPNEVAPDENLLIQGEIVEDVELNLFYNKDKTLMREAMKTAKQIKGLLAREYLKYYCDNNSYDELMELLKKYPKHVIEFGVYSRNLGFIPNRNTIIWEVRAY